MKKSAADRFNAGSEKVCTGKELAEALAKVELTAQEMRAWQKDRAKAKQSLKKQRTKW